MNNKSLVAKKEKGEGFLKGLLYALLPHIGCIGFILFSILGVTAATSIFKPLLLNPYFFHILIVISFIFATLSAVFYFKRQGFLGLAMVENDLEITFLPSSLKRKWKYLATLYGTTIFINLFLFMLIFPVLANVSSGSNLTGAFIAAFGGSGGELNLLAGSSMITLQVDIPCPGHSPLIIGELKGLNGVEDVKFKFPNLFDVVFNKEKASKEQIISLEVFKTYKATVVNEKDEANEVGAAADSALANIVQPELQNSPGSCCSGSSTGGCGCGCGR